MGDDRSDCCITFNNTCVGVGDLVQGKSMSVVSSPVSVVSPPVSVVSPPVSVVSPPVSVASPPVSVVSPPVSVVNPGTSKVTRPVRGFIEIITEPDKAEAKLADGAIMEKLVGCHVMTNILEESPLMDMVISCQDGRLGAHRAVLAAASPFIGYLLTKRMPGEVSTIVLPDVSMEIMQVVLTLCYTGQMVINSAIEDEVYAAMEMLMIGDQAKFTMLQVKPEVKKVEPEPEPVLSPPDANDNSSPQNDEISIPEEIPGPSTAVRGKRRVTTAAKPKGKQRKKSTTAAAAVEIAKPEEKTTPQEQPVEVIKVQEFPATGIMLIDGKSYVCSLCEGIISGKPAFISHLIHAHGKSLKSEKVEEEEVSDLETCGYCSESYSTITQTSQCLKSHGLSKCYVCFALLPSAELATHYRSIHGVRTAFALAAKCRWCDLGIAIGKNAIKPQLHAITEHITEALDRFSSPIKDDEVLTFISPTTHQDQSPANSLKRYNFRDHQAPPPGPASKKRKLDSDGKPLQLSKRTGKLAIKKTKKIHNNAARNLVRKNTKFVTQSPEFSTDPETGKLTQLDMSILPKAFVHLQSMALPTPSQRKANDDENTPPVPTQDIILPPQANLDDSFTSTATVARECKSEQMEVCPIFDFNEVIEVIDINDLPDSGLSSGSGSGGGVDFAILSSSFFKNSVTSHQAMNIDNLSYTSEEEEL